MWHVRGTAWVALSRGTRRMHAPSRRVHRSRSPATSCHGTLALASTEHCSASSRRRFPESRWPLWSRRGVAVSTCTSARSGRSSSTTRMLRARCTPLRLPPRARAVVRLACGELLLTIWGQHAHRAQCAWSTFPTQSRWSPNPFRVSRGRASRPNFKAPARPSILFVAEFSWCARETNRTKHLAHCRRFCPASRAPISTAVFVFVGERMADRP